MYPYDSMGRGFCQDELEEIFVRVGCEVVVGKSSLSLPLCKPFREASESENCVSNGFHNDLSLISIAQKMNASDNICASWHSSLLSKTRFPRNIFGVLLTVFTF